MVTFLSSHPDLQYYDGVTKLQAAMSGLPTASPEFKVSSMTTPQCTVTSLHFVRLSTRCGVCAVGCQTKWTVVGAAHKRERERERERGGGERERRERGVSFLQSLPMAFKHR
jgi:hypothetical protein